MTPLLGAVPLFIPGDIDCSDEVIAFDAISAAISEHGFVQRGPFRIAHSCSAVFGGRHDDTSALASQDQETFWVRAENVLRWLILNNHLPRDEPPRAGEALSVGCKEWPGDSEKNCE